MLPYARAKDEITKEVFHKGRLHDRNIWVRTRQKSGTDQ